MVTAAAAGDFSNEPYVGTLENDGVGLAGFHDFESKVAPTLADELDDREGRDHRRFDPGGVLPGLVAEQHHA